MRASSSAASVSAWILSNSASTLALSSSIWRFFSSSSARCFSRGESSGDAVLLKVGALDCAGLEKEGALGALVLLNAGAPVIVSAEERFFAVV